MRGECLVFFFDSEGAEHACNFFMFTDWYVEHEHFCAEHGKKEGKQGSL